MIIAPQPLDDSHRLDGFRCGNEALDSWLQKTALKNRAVASQSYVVTNGARVVGYYCLAAGSVRRKGAPGALRRNMSDPIPAVVLGRLAVDLEYAGQDIGRGLLQDALMRANGVQGIIGARALMVHAIDERARAFYIRFGFKAFPGDPLSLFIPLPWAL